MKCDMESRIYGNVFLAVAFFLFLFSVNCQLVVNVKNKGGDMNVEVIDSNTTADTVTLEFRKTDGTLVTQFIDFKSEVHVFRVLVLGEEELRQNNYQVLCFVLRFAKNEFISSDAMSKLRQKNPSAIRTPEEDKGQESNHMDILLSPEKAHVVSPHVYNICSEAKDSIFAKEADISILSRALGKDYNTMMSAVRHPPSDKVSRCNASSTNTACMCRYEVCVGWYPCGLKYCRGKDSTGKVVSYRCGIKTCKKCRAFDYYVHQKFQCLWDET